MIETPLFQKQWPLYWTEDERGSFAAYIAENPDAGDVIPDSAGLPKARWRRASGLDCLHPVRPSSELIEPQDLRCNQETEKMTRSRALQLLAEHKGLLTRRFGVTSLAVFGSTVRDEAREDSDVDILVAFDGPATSERYFGVQFYLEDLLGSPVDLVTEKALRPELRPHIEREAVRV